jgi:transcriptional regulator with XRE-family HTH domain
VPRDSNIIGPIVARLRYQRSWTQEDLVARLQVLGCYMTRNILASIETRRCPATDIQIEFFAFIFRTSKNELFPEKPHFSGKPVGVEKSIPTRRRRKECDQEVDEI